MKYIEASIEEIFQILRMESCIIEPTMQAIQPSIRCIKEYKIAHILLSNLTNNNSSGILLLNSQWRFNKFQQLFIFNFLIALVSIFKFQRCKKQRTVRHQKNSLHEPCDISSLSQNRISINFF
jgi:hypothetical protein